MKVVIIGGAGFIGSNTAEYHIKSGDEVLILDNFSRKGSYDNLKWLQSFYPALKYMHVDIRSDKKELLYSFDGKDLIYHFGAQVAVTTSVINPYKDFEINCLGTINVLEAIRKCKKRPAIIFTSTNKVYGEMNDLKVIEDKGRYTYADLPCGVSEKFNLDFHSPYGCSKGAADQYVIDYSRIYDIKSIVFRMSCIYGPRQFGIEDQGWVAWFIIAALTNKHVTIYGDGKQVRDVLYVGDLINAFSLAYKNIDKIKGNVFNIGGGCNNTLSLLELIKYIEEFTGKEIMYNYSNWRAGDQKIYISNIEKANNIFGWNPKISTIEGVKFLLEWVNDNLTLFK